MVNGVEARRIAYSLAISQEGVFSRRQAVRRGITDDVLRYWLRSGYIFRFLPGVYSLGRPGETDEAQWMAGVLYAGDGSILAGEAAARAWGMSESFRSVEVARPYGKSSRVDGFPPHQRIKFTFRKGSIQPDDFARTRSLPLMEPARLLIDLCARVEEGRLRRYFIEAGRNGLLTQARLDRMDGRSHSFRNRKRLTRLAGLWDPTTGRIRSILEGEFKLLCAEGKIPAPRTNHPVGRYEVDAVWLEERLAVELDGRKFHSDAVALESDSEKSRHLRSIGFRVLRFSWNDVVERPEWVLEQVREALGSNHRRMTPVI